MQPIYDRAVSGMLASQQTLDIVSNNLANSNTTGFDATLPDLTDLVYQSVDARSVLGTSATTPIGVGTQLVGTTRSLIAGPAQVTNNPLDVMIAGEGYLQVSLPNGQTAYTRAGLLRVDGQGQVNIRGMLVQPPITIPNGSADIGIRPDGSVVAQESTNPTVVGQLQLARFPNEQGLQSLDGTLYTPTVTSGAPVVGTPGQSGFGALQSGYLEGARVDMAREMSALIIAERAFGLNSRTLQTLDSMLGKATQGR